MIPERLPVWLSGHEHLLTFMTEAEYQERRQYISEHKSPAERPLRLYLMRKVRGELPAAVVEAHAALLKANLALVEANLALVEARVACVETFAAWVKAIADNMPAIEALHRSEVPDTTWNGTTIFSEGWEKHPKAREQGE